MEQKKLKLAVIALALALILLSIAFATVYFTLQIPSTVQVKSYEIELWNEAEMQVTDGNENLLYKQRYSFTDAKVEVTVWLENGVLILPSEH